MLCNYCLKDKPSFIIDEILTQGGCKNCHEKKWVKILLSQHKSGVCSYNGKQFLKLKGLIK